MGGKKKDEAPPAAEQVETSTEVAPELETAFERRIARLSEIAEEAEFESGSLLGDVRDLVVDLFKQRPKPWSQLSEMEQRDTVKGIEVTARVIIRKLVTVIAEEDEISVHATLTGYSVDGDTFKLKATAKGDEDTAIQLFRLDGHEVVLISADSKRFNGQRKDPDVQADQLGMGFADAENKDDGKPAGGQGPEGDADLAGEEAGEPVGQSVKTVDDLLMTGDLVQFASGVLKVGINLESSMVEGEDDAGKVVDVRTATTDELAAERERRQDNFDEGAEAAAPEAVEEGEPAST